MPSSDRLAEQPTVSFSHGRNRHERMSSNKVVTPVLR